MDNNTTNSRDLVTKTSATYGMIAGIVLGFAMARMNIGTDEFSFLSDWKFWLFLGVGILLSLLSRKTRYPKKD